VQQLEQLVNEVMDKILAESYGKQSWKFKEGSGLRWVYRHQMIFQKRHAPPPLTYLPTHLSATRKPSKKTTLDDGSLVMARKYYSSFGTQLPSILL
jgi:hypothetical protein